MNTIEVRPIGEQKMQALAAKGLFVHASEQNPASVTSQAARIAYRCQQKGWDPQVLGMSLLGDNSLVGDIHREAIEKHAKVGKGPINPAEFPFSRVEGIVDAVFERASVLIVLTPEQLRKLYGEVYLQYRDTISYTGDLNIRAVASIMVNDFREKQNNDTVAGFTE